MHDAKRLQQSQHHFELFETQFKALALLTKTHCNFALVWLINPPIALTTESDSRWLRSKHCAGTKTVPGKHREELNPAAVDLRVMRQRVRESTSARWHPLLLCIIVSLAVLGFENGIREVE